MPDFYQILKDLAAVAGTLIKEYGLEAAAFGIEGVGMKVVSQGLSVLEKKLQQLDADIKIGAEDFTPYGAIKYWNNVYGKISNVNEGLGVAGNLGKALKNEFKDAYVGLVEIGVGAEELSKNIKQFSDDYGRITLMSKQEMIEMSSFAKIFGQDSIAILASYRDLGISIEASTARMKKLTLESNKYGVLPSRAVKLIKDNLSAVDKYYFKGGTKAFEQMALKAASLNNDMKGAFTMIDKILDGGIEGAVELAQEFQIMGGPIAQMGDTFGLIQKAMSGDIEGLTNDMAKAAAQMATINSEGEIMFDPAAMMQFRQLASKTGVDITEITKLGRAMAKEMDVGKQLDLSLRGTPEKFEAMSKKVAAAVSGKDAFGNWVVTIDGIQKKVQDLTDEDINAKLSISPEGDEKDTFKEIVKSNMDLGDIINKAIEQLKVIALAGAGEAYQKLIGVAREGADNLVAALTPFAESFSKMSEGAYKNFEPILEALSKGEFLNALGAVAVNLGKVLTALYILTSPSALLGILIGEALQIIKNLAWNAGQYIIGGVTYLIKWAITEIGNMIVNPILRLLYLPEVDFSSTLPTFEEHMKNMGLKIVDVFKDVNFEKYIDSFKGYKEVPGLSWMESANLRDKIPDDKRNALDFQNVKGVFEHSGKIVVALPDGTERELTAKEIEEIYDKVKGVLKGQVNLPGN